VIERVIRTAQEMGALGALVASRLQAGDVVALNGDLGAGKTTFTRGLGEALEVRGRVTSPTFVLARTHPRQHGAPLVHMDAYRLGSALELDDLDVDVEQSIVVVEWAGEMVDLLADTWLQIDIVRHGGGSTAEPDDENESPRTVRLHGHGERWSDLDWLRG
jgi:tRNA threonylcarbamoyladenosine biosynthesis protein TsaE